jgi:hypothetical protein
LVAAGRGSTTLRNCFWVIQFHVCGYAAATMLWMNHRKCCVGLGASTREFYREVRFELARFCRALNKKENVLLRKALAQRSREVVPEVTYPDAVLQQ